MVFSYLRSHVQSRIMTRTPRTRRAPKPRQPKTVRLDYNFAGIPAGSLMFVATPEIIEAFMRAIPEGETRTIAAMRRELARRRKCDDTCPVSTAIFIRQVAERALRELGDGRAIAQVAPFWRLISGADKIAMRLPVDPDRIDTQRNPEASGR